MIKPHTATGASSGASSSSSSSSASSSSHVPLSRRISQCARRISALRHRAPSLKRLVFLALLASSVVLVCLSGIFITKTWQAAVEQDVDHDLSQISMLVASAVGDSQGEAEIEKLRTLDTKNIRLTLIAPSGDVIYDSKSDPKLMENHARRPEVIQALRSGEGSDVRDSETLGSASYYHARRLKSGNVIRVAEQRASALGVIVGEPRVLIFTIAATVVLSWVAAHVLSRGLVAPILAIDPQSSHKASPYQELVPLVSRLEEQQRTLVEQMGQLRDAESMRQEFTSNVTHELKTPLASISGAAELIRDGIAQPQDVAGFAGRIFDETQRLTSLVNDILTLSKLDETERAGSTDIMGTMQPCNLYAVARDVAARLQPMAKEAEVSLAVHGSFAVVQGNARLLDELINNLCTNAIRYNRANGRVTVTVGSDHEGNPFVRVADTGIGIAAADQQKIFERFYRVDKGRSRVGGGTGLGLAIVKHAAAFHQASLELESTPGVGTTITVRFAKQS